LKAVVFEHSVNINRVPSREVNLEGPLWKNDYILDIDPLGVEVTFKKNNEVIIVPWGNVLSIKRI
jgi:hypothetical protein